MRNFKTSGIAEESEEIALSSCLTPNANTVHYIKCLQRIDEMHSAFSLILGVDYMSFGNSATNII